jgi:hypothetical protein
VRKATHKGDRFTLGGIRTGTKETCISVGLSFGFDFNAELENRTGLVPEEMNTI